MALLISVLHRVRVSMEQSSSRFISHKPLGAQPSFDKLILRRKVCPCVGLVVTEHFSPQLQAFATVLNDRYNDRQLPFFHNLFYTPLLALTRTPCFPHLAVPHTSSCTSVSAPISLTKAVVQRLHPGAITLSQQRCHPRPHPQIPPKSAA